MVVSAPRVISCHCFECANEAAPGRGSDSRTVVPLAEVTRFLTTLVTAGECPFLGAQHRLCHREAWGGHGLHGSLSRQGLPWGGAASRRLTRNSQGSWEMNENKQTNSLRSTQRKKNHILLPSS
nr:uncharacterized protein LOC103892299 [Pongo abelii]